MIVVVGAGVVGLGSAFCLLRRGYSDVTVVAKDLSPDTTSDRAGGLWRPFAVESPKVNVWGKDTLQFLLECRRDFGSEATGIALFSGYELFAKPVADPDWKDQVLGFRTANEDELKLLMRDCKFKHAWFYTTCIVDSSVYLPWLTAKIRAMGGRVERREVRSLSELSGASLIVNCTGLGAREFVQDSTIHAVRGQIVRVKAPSVHHFWSCDDDADEGKLMYILPRNNNIVCGGTYQVGNTSLELSKEDRKHILDSCSEVVPELRTAHVDKEYAALRPSRPSVRLELESKCALAGGKPVIHCYGHGGSGVTLHYGCALDVVQLAESVVRPGGKQIRSKL